MKTNIFSRLGFFCATGAMLLTSVTPVYAESVREVKQDLRDARQELRDAKKELRAEIREKAGSRPGLLKDFLKRGRAAIGSGEVTAKSGTTLTVEKDGKSYTVLTDSQTQFRKRFWGKSSLDEILVGHTVNVIGIWTDDAHTTIQAKVVRDVSLQRRFGVFIGMVQSLTSNGWVMTTLSEKRENQTVTISGSTKLVNRREQPITQADILVGHRVRVKGMWDRSTNTVTEVIHVKDFSLPPQAAGTPAPTSAPTSAPTVAPTATPTVAPTATSTPTPTP